MSSRRRTDRGSASVEFALVLPVVMLLVVGAIRIGTAFNMKIEMTGAAREGARWMVIHPTDQGGARTAAQAAATGLGLTTGEILISANCVTGATPPVSVTVTVERQVAIDIPFGPTGSYWVRGVANMQC